MSTRRGTTCRVFCAARRLPIARRVSSPARHARFEAFVTATEMPVATLALLVAPVLVLESHTDRALVRHIAHGVNWAIWLVFCGEYLGKVVLAPERRAYLRTSWPDLLIVIGALPISLSVELLPARAVSLLRFLRGAAVAAIGFRLRVHVLRPNRLQLGIVTTILVLVLGALGIFTVEHGVNQHIRTFGDALWWSVVTATTVGYGDVSPVTPEGKFIAVGLMLLGIGFVGVFTATISSEFFDHGRVNQVEERLARIEAKLDRLHADALRLSLPEAINVKE